MTSVQQKTFVSPFYALKLLLLVVIGFNVLILITQAFNSFGSTCTHAPTRFNNMLNVRDTPSSKTRIGIIVPSTTRGMIIKDINKFSLVDICIRSINKTVEPNYDYTVYVGIDMKDELLKYRGFIETFSRPLDVVIVTVNGNTFNKAVNVVAYQAVKDGMDYLVRINDDIRFVTPNWTSIAIRSLQNNHPPNVGVVGPTCHQGNENILTTDFVHVTHYHIFGFYYPPVFDNWWVDDWMTLVYMPLRSKKLISWGVRHEIMYRSRYKKDPKQKYLLDTLVKFGNHTITWYINKQQRHNFI